MSIIGSQSRYELQQQISLNPTGMKTSTTNRFGIVDSSNRISAIGSQSHKIRVASIGQGTVAAQPVLNENFWGKQSSMYFGGAGTWFDENNTYFKPNWDQPSFLGCKIHYLENTTQAQVIYYRSEITVEYNAFVVAIMATFGTKGAVEMGLSAYDPVTDTYPRKLVYTTETLVLGNTYDIIFINPGTDNALDWKIFINGVEATLNVYGTLNQSFAGCVSYPGFNDSKIRIGTDQSGSNWFKGYMGKVIEGMGTPNITALRNALNTI